jgi:sugar O-acyltransferase (sialic acid O-acetyltransferase NeuD family)
MSHPRVIILGAGGHARVIIEAIRLSGAAEIVAAIDSNPALHGTEMGGIKIMGGDNCIAALAANGATHFAVAIGSIGRTDLRAKLFALGIAAKLQPLTIAHPSAICSASATIGSGVQLLAGCIVNTQASIAPNVIVNCGAIVEHDCVVGMHSHIASGSCLCGGVIIGERSHIGARATILQGIRIGSRAVIGAGAVVVRDVEDDETVAGVPARILHPK